MHDRWSPGLLSSGPYGTHYFISDLISCFLCSVLSPDGLRFISPVPRVGKDVSNLREILPNECGNTADSGPGVGDAWRVVHVLH